MFLPYTGPMQYHECGWLGSSSIVYGGVVHFDAGTGYIEVGAAASASLYGVNIGPTQTASATNGATKTLIIPFQSGQVWVVDTTGDLVQTLVGTIASLTDAVTLDEDDAGNTPLFEIVGYVGALSARKALVRPHMANFTSIGA